MGTSSYFGGPNNNQPLLPPWADEAFDYGNDPDQSNQGQNGGEPSPENGNSELPITQPSPSRPATINFSPIRHQVRQYSSGHLSGGGGRRILKAYVKGTGGARNSARASRAGRSTTAGIGRFARNIAIHGVEEALESLNLSDVIGQSAITILSRVTEALLTNATSVDDREAARNATYETLDAMYERYNQGTDDFTVLDAMNLEEVSEFVTLSVCNYIYERVMQVAERTFEGNELNHAQLFNMELELRGFIQADVDREFSDVDIAGIDWNNSDSAQIVMQLYERAYEIWEALQE